jgi:hypothetical protein
MLLYPGELYRLLGASSFYFELGDHLGWKSGSPDTILEGAIQESFQQSLVEIGSVVSEEKIFF